MFIQGGSIDEDVIQVDGNLACGDKLHENGVHKGLEGCQGVGQFEQHHLRFEEASVCGECGLPFIIGFDLNVVILLAHVKLGENAGLMETIDNVGCKQEKIVILTVKLFSF